MICKAISAPPAAGHPKLHVYHRSYSWKRCVHYHPASMSETTVSLGRSLKGERQVD